MSCYLLSPSFHSCAWHAQQVRQGNAGMSYITSVPLLLIQLSYCSRLAACSWEVTSPKRSPPLTNVQAKVLKKSLSRSQTITPLVHGDLIGTLKDQAANNTTTTPPLNVGGNPAFSRLQLARDIFTLPKLVPRFTTVLVGRAVCAAPRLLHHTCMVCASTFPMPISRA